MLQCFLYRVVSLTDVKVIERFGDVEITVGVKAADEFLALMLEITLNSKLRGEGVGNLRSCLQATAEFGVERIIAHIGHVADHAGDSQTIGGRLAPIIVAVAPVRIGIDGTPTDLVERDVLCR